MPESENVKENSAISSTRHLKYNPGFCEKLRKKFCNSDEPETNRVVYVDNQSLPGEDLLELPQYPDNVVKSSKYTLFTFLPKNLFEQFRRIANFYFLCVAIIQCMIDTPVTPMTSVLPLFFVISVTAFKQGYEDWLRHKADNEVNLRPVTIVRDGKAENVRALDIQVGDIVKMYTNDAFPCDMVLISSADPLGVCYVTTANLDGETNLKTFTCLSEMRSYHTPEKLGELRARITAKPPLPDLYTFEGVLELEHVCTVNEQKPLGPEHLLLRGARLKNTEYIYGCALYTGRETKMALNSKFKIVKFSQVERKMNAFLIIFLVLLLLECSLSTALMYWKEHRDGEPDYVPDEDDRAKAVEVLETLLSFMVLYNYVIPISLYVTIELQKFLGSIFFGLDCKMYDASLNERALANTSDLNEELGQVEYLFTDKTGTLTENTMEFRKCCIGSRQFEDIDGQLCERFHPEGTPTSDLEWNDEIDVFIRVLVLCHTVRVDKREDTNASCHGASSVYSATGSDYEYQASSPDEKALVEAACRYGIIYHGMKDDTMEVTFHKTMCRYKLLQTLPFDATRKRMSVIVQDDEGRIFLLCKGAEVAIFDRVIEGDVTTAQRMVDEYATLGLRTLTIAQRKLDRAEYEEINEKLAIARTSLTRRDEMSAEVFNEVEDKLTLLGATAVEDKLQDGVPDTIEALRLAGIKVWVLTGDKEETAVNISHSAGHFNTKMTEIRLTQVNSEEGCVEQMRHLLHVTSKQSGSGSQRSQTEFDNPALVIDGQTLTYALKFPDQLYQLCSQCVAVLCCRMSPIQKAKVVALIKYSPHKPVTAAIGDGANDVSMIQEADVGIGIMGKEGRQAVRNSDYAFGKFRFLQRVLLFHGHLFYYRIAILVQYFFYKNVAFVTSQLLYAFWSYFSQQSLYDPFFLLSYNLFFTSLPILMYGLFEQHKTQEELLGKPHLYKTVTRNALLSWRQFLKWNGLGLWHCCVFYFGFMLLLLDDVSIFSTGKLVGNFGYGTYVYYTCVIAVNLKLLLETYFWCLPIVGSFIFTFASLLVLTAIYTNVWWPSWIAELNHVYKIMDQLFSAPTPWLAACMLIFLALLPDIIIKALRDTQDDIVRKQSSDPQGSSSRPGLEGGKTPITSSDYQVNDERKDPDIFKIKYKGNKVNVEMHQIGSEKIPGSKHAYDNPVAVDSLPDDANPLPSVEIFKGSPSHTITTVSEAPSRGHTPEVPKVAVTSGKMLSNMINNSVTTVREVKPIMLESTHL